MFQKKELLDRWHFKNNNRTPPIFALADVGYGFQDLLDNANYYMKEHKIRGLQKPKLLTAFKILLVCADITELGIHGYDNKVPNMHPFFMARGPKIRKNYKIRPFKTVDLFNLFCDILEMKPTKNNGTFENVQAMVIQSSSKLWYTFSAVGKSK